MAAQVDHGSNVQPIGLMELHVIPNVCSEYSEQKIQAMEGISGQSFTQPDLVHLFDLHSTYSPKCLQGSKPESLDSGFFILGRTERVRERAGVNEPAQRSCSSLLHV